HARPHQPIAHRAERAGERRLHPLDLGRRHPLVLRLGNRADGYPRQVGVRVEEPDGPPHRLPIARSGGATGEISQQRLERARDTDATHALVVPRTLNREQPEPGRDQPRLHRSTSSASPAAIPTANHLRPIDGPAVRSVPATAVLMPAPITTASSSEPARGESGAQPRARPASSKPAAVRRSARTESRKTPC